MPRDYRVYREDIMEAIARIRSYTSGMSIQSFVNDAKTFDAVVRNLEIIGEATKKVPEHLRTQNSDIDWKKIASLRDILIHEYFGIDTEIIWDIIQSKLPILEKQVSRMLV